jgi:crotonobetainyl-CoA:carnitine CoA-transferase CaiB-like acyl-CoA transferase
MASDSQSDNTTDRYPPLAGVRVVDVTSASGEMAGRVLADLGAEVIKVEPPDGAEARRLPPFDADGASLFWRSLGTGKRSVELEVASPAFARLLSSADVLLESFDAPEADHLGLAPDVISARYETLVHVSITPFGRDGPKSAYTSSDLISQAAGGLLGMQGDVDRPHVPLPFNQAEAHAGAQAAADTVIALCHRQSTGAGQHLDVSIQTAVVWTLMNATGFPPATGRNPPASGEFRSNPPAPRPGRVRVRVPKIVPCVDGTVLCGLQLPGIGERTLHNMSLWLAEEDDLPSTLEGITWHGWIGRVASGELVPELVSQAMDAVVAKFASLTQAEIQKVATARKFLVAPIYGAADLLADPQLIDRGFWQKIDGLCFAGPFARLSETPLAPLCPAPALGADDGLLNRERPRQRRTAIPTNSELTNGATAKADQPFAGLKVADFAWVGVGPMISKALADHGATVVHVESSTRPDVLRTLPPFLDDERGANRSHFQANFNTSKLAMTLDMSTPAGRQVGRRLADWADVVVESFTPGTMARLGLDYETLSENRDDLVMLSTCMRGQTGPERGYTGFGGQGAALAGLFATTGWPDREPCGPWGAYTDFVTPRYGVAALAAAVLHRKLTGRGQYIDLSQIEASIRFQEPYLLAHQATGHPVAPMGTDSDRALVQGVYATRVADRFVAIAAETEAQRQALLDTIGTEIGAESDAGTHEAIARWCGEQEGAAIEAQLQGRGVPSHEVNWPSDLYRDPQLAFRGFFHRLQHAEMGEMSFDGPVTLFSATPPRLTAAACLGADNNKVMSELLGYSDAQIVALAEVLV